MLKNRWNRWLAALAMALALLWPPDASAQTPKRLAVLELRGSTEIETKVLRSLADKARAGALEGVLGRGYIVMTQESMAVMLKDMGLEECTSEGECEVETARNIGADLVVSGEVVRIQGRLLLSLKLHETKAGGLLAMEAVEGKDGLELIRKTQATSRALLQKGLVASTSAVRSATRTLEEGRIGGRSDDFVIEDNDVVVAFESEPPGATVMVAGELLCAATPCRRQMRAGGHEVLMSMERYASTHERFVAKTNAAVKLKLAPNFARVQVDSTPSGVSVTLDGKPAGQTPLALEVDPGSREVLVGDGCWVPEGERVNVAAGDARRVYVTLKPRLSAIKVSAEEANGNVVEGVVSIDGKRLGRSPGTFKVPVCSKEVVIVGPSGTRWSERLYLQEHQISNVRATFSGTFMQPSTRLEWQRYPAPKTMGWEDAEAHCVGLSFAGIHWRLPTQDELVGLYKDRHKFTEVPGMHHGWYWSSSVPEFVSNGAKVVDFTYGNVSNYYVSITDSYRVRCVHGKLTGAQEKKVEKTTWNSGLQRRQWAVRGGVGGQTGVLGVGVEWRPTFVGFAVGTGTHLATFGLTFGSAANDGGLYGDLHLALVQPGLVSSIPEGTATFGLGATAGYDWRPVPWLSVKTGAGYAWNRAKSGGGFIWDLNLGPVF